MHENSDITMLNLLTGYVLDHIHEPHRKKKCYSLSLIYYYVYLVGVIHLVLLYF